MPVHVASLPQSPPLSILYPREIGLSVRSTYRLPAFRRFFVSGRLVLLLFIHRTYLRMRPKRHTTIDFLFTKRRRRLSTLIITLGCHVSHNPLLFINRIQFWKRSENIDNSETYTVLEPLWGFEDWPCEINLKSIIKAPSS